MERLWPRGLSTEKAAIDLGLKGVAPSTEVRRWFGHDPRKWAECRTRYRAELEDKGDVITILRERLNEGPVTFLCAAKDEEHNSAITLNGVSGAAGKVIRPRPQPDRHDRRCDRGRGQVLEAESGRTSAPEPRRSPAPTRNLVSYCGSTTTSVLTELAMKQP